MQRTVAGNTDIWILDDARVSRFTFDAGNDLYPTWSPDGGRIVFDSDRSEFSPDGRWVAHQYDIAADGRFLINVTIGDESTSPITLLMNWTPPQK